MIDGVIINKLSRYDDKRGWLAEIFRADECAIAPAMAYVSVTKPGVVRGPHEHVRQSDLFVFAGPGSFALHLWDRRVGSPTRGEYYTAVFGAEDPASVIVPPGVVHGYKCVSAGEGYCFNLPDQLYKGQGKRSAIDEIRWEDDPESPYRID